MWVILLLLNNQGRADQGDVFMAARLAVSKSSDLVPSA